MRQRVRGQSLVEIALILPLLVLIIFGIIDLGYYVYGYSTIYQAARNAAEKASQFPPYPNQVGYKTSSGTQPPSGWPEGKPLRNDAGQWKDACVIQVLNKLQEDATLFPDLTDAGKDYITIKYPNRDPSNQPFRQLAQPIEISIRYPVQPLTPLFRFVAFGSNGVLTVQTTARRSIESLGNNPNGSDGTVCSPN